MGGEVCLVSLTFHRGKTSPTLSEAAAGAAETCLKNADDANNPTPILCSEIAKNSTLFGSSSQSSAFSPWLPLRSCRLFYIDNCKELLKIRIDISKGIY